MKVMFDLDGTIALYNGWRGETHIGDPIPAMIDLMKTHIANGHNVVIFTARMSDPDPEARKRIEKAVGDWTAFHVGKRLPVTCKKDYSVSLIYDDRAVQVVHNKGRIVEDDLFRAIRLLKMLSPNAEVDALIEEFGGVYGPLP